MGGGFTQAIKEHITAGFAVSSTVAATRGIHDNEEVVRALGVTVQATCPEGSVPVFLADYAPEFWGGLLRQAGLPLPHLVLAAAQDHGFHTHGNRKGRMLAWTELLASSADPARWIYTTPPPSLTRLAPLHEKTGGPVADTGASALLGALCDKEVMDRSYRQGITIINVGNGHTVAALVYRGLVRGIYEHHTGMPPPLSLFAFLPFRPLLRPLPSLFVCCPWPVTFCPVFFVRCCLPFCSNSSAQESIHRYGRRTPCARRGSC